MPLLEVLPAASEALPAASAKRSRALTITPGRRGGARSVVALRTRWTKRRSNHRRGYPLLWEVRAWDAF